MMSNYLYLNPHKGMINDQATRNAAMHAIDVDELVKQTFFGRGKSARRCTRRTCWPPSTGNRR